MLHNTVYRARCIIAESEGLNEMIALIETRERKQLQSDAARNIVPNDRLNPFDRNFDKVDRLNAAARLVLTCRTRQQSSAEIIETLDEAEPRPGGWSMESLRSVELYARAHCERVTVDLSKVKPLISELRKTLTARQIVGHLTDNCIENPHGGVWTLRQVNSIIAKINKYIGKNKDVEHEPEPIIGKRPMRKADIEMRQRAREVASAKHEAWQQAVALRQEIAEMQARLALAEHTVERANEAEAFLLSTGSAELVELREELIRDSIRKRAQSQDESTINQSAATIADIERQIMSSDWR